MTIYHYEELLLSGKSLHFQCARAKHAQNHTQQGCAV